MQHLGRPSRLVRLSRVMLAVFILVGLLVSEIGPLPLAAGTPTPPARTQNQPQDTKYFMPISEAQGIEAPPPAPDLTPGVANGPGTSPPPATATPNRTATPTATGAPAAASPTQSATGAPAASPTPSATSAPASPTPSATSAPSPTATPSGSEGGINLALTLWATRVTSDSVSLYWEPASDPVGVTGYEVLLGDTVVAAASGFQTVVGGLLSDTEYLFTVRARDAAGNRSARSNEAWARTAAFDPTLVVPPINARYPLDFLKNVEFLYQGASAVQQGVTATFDTNLASVLRGVVRDRSGAPLPGVRVSVNGRPEWGWTYSRANGRYDLVVHGGLPMTVDLEKDGYLPSQRTLPTTRVNDYIVAPDVVLIGLDTRATTVTLTGSEPAQVARGSVVSDTRGTRQATVVFPRGVTASLVLSNGALSPLTTLTVRATEYTVGPTGPLAMPGSLPPNVAYTYAVELSVDEAMAVGAREVRFSQPVYLYVDNFLGFPVGSPVPVGYYDRSLGAWIPSDNGRIIKVLSVSGGIADVDVDGDGIAESSAVLEALGFTLEERQRLATTYPVGAELWRTPILHFTPWDCNWPYGPPADAKEPKGKRERNEDKDDPCPKNGSIIECENQVLGERLPVAGTDYTLNYRSDRAEAWSRDKIKVQLTEETVPASLKRVELRISVMGVVIENVYAPAPKLKYEFRWNGLDAYGRPLKGRYWVNFLLSYVYPAEYYGPDAFPQSFARFASDANIAGRRDTGEIAISVNFSELVEAKSLILDDVGGWAFDVHHFYDFRNRTLYLGDGSQRRSEVLAGVGKVANASGEYCVGGYGAPCGDGGSALNATFKHITGLAVGQDGGLFVADGGHGRVRRILPNGTIVNAAGVGDGWLDGGVPDGVRVPAVSAVLNGREGLDVAVAPDGSLYIAEAAGNRVNRVRPDGMMERVAGKWNDDLSWEFGCGGRIYYNPSSFDEEGPAIQTPLRCPSAIAVAPDNALYVFEYDRKLLRVVRDGRITTFAGGGTCRENNCRASEADLTGLSSFALMEDGSIVFTQEDEDTPYRRIGRIWPSGDVETIAGRGSRLGDDADGRPAVEAALQSAGGIAVSREGDILFVDGDYRYARPGWLRAIGPDGKLKSLAGGENRNFPQGQSWDSPGASVTSKRLAVHPDGRVFYIDGKTGVVKLDKQQVSIPANGLAVASPDGSEVFVFDGGGFHLRTLDALTGATRYEFEYMWNGQLIGIVDVHGRRTRIERDSSGYPTAIVAPFGQRTVVTLNGVMLASITNPMNERFEFTYAPGGLLTSMKRPRGGLSTFAYDADRRLIRDTNPIGGEMRLAKSELGFEEFGSSVTITDTLGKVSRFETRYFPDESNPQEVETREFAPNGAETTSIRKRDGKRITINPNGTVITTTLAPDPRFGMSAPYVKSRVVGDASGAILYQMAATRTVQLANPDNPFSLVMLSHVMNENGRMSYVTYTASSRTLTHVDVDGVQTVTVLDERGRPVSETRSGRAPVTFTRDSLGRITSITEGTGAEARTTTFTFGSNGKVASFTDALGRTVRFTYDLAGRETRRELPLGFVEERAYDADGNLIRLTEASGVTTRYQYDLAGRRTASVVDPDGLAIRTEYRYDKADNLVEIIEDAGSGRTNATTRLSYVPTGMHTYQPSRIVDPVGATTLISYTVTGEVRAITDPSGSTTSYFYDGADRLTQATSSLGRTFRWRYNRNGLVEEAVDPSGVTTRFVYDAAGRITSVIEGAAAVGSSPAINATTQFGYDASGRMATITDPLGRVTTRTFDSFGRLVEERDPLNNVTRMDYDKVDRVTAVSFGDNVPAERRKVAYEYDALGRRVAQTIDPDGLALRTEYRYSRAGSSDRFGLQEVVDPEGGVTVYTYNSVGWLERVTDALGQVWQFGYNTRGDLVRQVDPLGRETTFTVDAKGQRTAVQEGTAVERWSYRPDGQVASYTDFAGQQTTLSYDADGRLVGISYPGGLPSVSLSYDGAGRRTQMTDGLGTTTYSYDALGRMVSRSRSGRTVTYQYDAASQLTSVDYWGRGTVAYQFDAASRASSLAPWGGGDVTFGWSASHELKSEGRPGGVNTTHTYDGAGRRTRSTTGSLLDLQYTLDRRNNRLAMTDNDGTTEFQYDALSRLTQVRYPAVGSLPAKEVGYQYDAVGNRTSESVTSSGTTTRAFSYDGRNRITNPGYQYDANGNLLSDGVNSYSYDGANRLTQSVVVSGTQVITTTYGYDGLGNLVRQTINGVTSDLVIDERGPLAFILGEVRSDGVEILYAHGPNGLAAQKRFEGGVGQGVEYALVDPFGTVRALVDGGGIVRRRVSYLAFGQVRHASGPGWSTLGFLGERMGEADGTLYLRARVMNPSHGRFLQRDVFRGLEFRPQSLNRYIYAENNPVRFLDRSGFAADEPQRGFWERAFDWVAGHSKLVGGGPKHEYKPSFDSGKPETKYAVEIKPQVTDAIDKRTVKGFDCLPIGPNTYIPVTSQSTLTVGEIKVEPTLGYDFGKGFAVDKETGQRKYREGRNATLGGEFTIVKLESVATYGTENFGLTFGSETKGGGFGLLGGLKDGVLAAQATVNGVSEALKVGVNIWGVNIAAKGEIGAKVEWGFKLGKGIEVKTPLYSVGLEIGPPPPAPKSSGCCD